MENYNIIQIRNEINDTFRWVLDAPTWETPPTPERVMEIAIEIVGILHLIKDRKDGTI